MKTWITADQHFGHTNIIKYCKRPFKSTHEMDSTMIKNWCRTVNPGDRVYHLGDFALVPFDRMQRLVKTLPGYKILILGNHDKSKARMLEAGFDEVYETLLLVNHNILTHCPMFMEGKTTINVGVDVNDFTPIPFPEKKDLILCGHIHELWKVRGYTPL